MKSLKNPVLLFLILGIALGCSYEKTQTTHICVLIDITDERFKSDNFADENLPKLLSAMNLDRQKGGYSGGEIKLSLINEISDSKSKTITIETAKTGMMGENPLNRKDQVNRFYAQLETAISEIFEKASWGTDASKIYQKVARELIKMKQVQADRKTMVIFSDMLENSELFSFYGSNWKNSIENLMENPDQTIEKLAQKGPELPDLSEFTIYIVTNRTQENDQKINLSEQFWTKILEAKGATVRFNSTLEF